MAKKTLPKIKIKESALLIVDMQNDFCKPDGYFGTVRKRDMAPILQIIPNIQKLLAFARENDMLRVFVNTIHSSFTDSENWKARLGNENQGSDHSLSLCAPDTYGVEVVEELTPRLDEPVVIKHRYSAFLQTDLELLLRNKKIRNLFVTGNATNVCVETTSRHAFMLDFLTITVRDCVATSDQEGAHEAALRNLENYFGYVAGTEEILASLS